MVKSLKLVEIVELVEIPILHQTTLRI